MKQVLEYFGDVEPFIRENENDHLAPATTGQLLDIFNDASDAKELELELAALVDEGSHCHSYLLSRRGWASYIQLL